MSDRIKPAPKRPELEQLLEAAKNFKWTPEHREAQRKSWVIGELMLEHPGMTYEEAEQLYNGATP